MSCKILLAGSGGQGILFAHQLLAECAVAQGLDVTGAETHGMSQRGGSVSSHLKIGEPLAPLIRQGTADFLIAFDAAEAQRNLGFIRPGGTVVVNSGRLDMPTEVCGLLDQLGVTLRRLDADGIASQLGRFSVANVALIGLASTSADFPLQAAALRETLRRLSPERFCEVNLSAFDRGVQAGNENPK